MESHKLVIKFYVEDDSAISAHEFVPIFHSWIQRRAVPEHTLIDVTDYAHVQNGPGTVLIAHEANFYTDRYDRRLGFAYSRKQEAPGSFQDRLRQAFAGALEGCARLEEDPRLTGKIKFRTNEALLQINDRLLAPNTSAMFQQVRPELEQFLSGLYSESDVQLDHTASPLTLFTVRISASTSPSISELLSRLGAKAQATA